MQIHTILQCIHEFFSFEAESKKAGSKLRRALYMAVEGGRLDLMYAWNGVANDCVKPHPDRFTLTSHKGLRSVAAETYHIAGRNPATVIEDCVNDPDFEFFDPEQRTYLRSMIVIKYEVTFDGIETAMILTLDTDIPSFFTEARKDEMLTFILEMLRRLELEFLNLAYREPLGTESSK